MRHLSIEDIAQVITEDPDIINEVNLRRINKRLRHMLENFEEQDPDWWKSEEMKDEEWFNEQKDKLRKYFEQYGASEEDIEEYLNAPREELLAAIQRLNEISGPRNRGGSESRNDYASADSLYETPPDALIKRRKDMEDIYAYQQKILDWAEKTPRDKLLNILAKINPQKDYSTESDDNLGYYIYTDFPTKGKPEGYKELIQFLNREMRS